MLPSQFIIRRGACTCSRLACVGATVGDSMDELISFLKILLTENGESQAAAVVQMLGFK